MSVLVIHHIAMAMFLHRVISPCQTWRILYVCYNCTHHSLALLNEGTTGLTLFYTILYSLSSFFNHSKRDSILKLNIVRIVKAYCYIKSNWLSVYKCVECVFILNKPITAYTFRGVLCSCTCASVCPSRVRLFTSPTAEKLVVTLNYV